MPEPVPSDGKAVVDITYCGICGTDVHAFLSGHPYNPAICGHEWVGHVSSLPAVAPGLREGDRVAIGVSAACGHCATCRRGDAAHCEIAFAGAIGAGPMAAAHGGFARAIAFDIARLYHVPAAMTDTQAALLEPATVAVHALRRTPIKLGDSVVVIGAGPIGLLVLQAARLAGASRTVVLEMEATRRQRAKDLGTDLVLDPTDGDPTVEINDYLGQSGADVVFECAGVPATIQTAVDIVRRGGLVSLVGVASGQASIDPASWLVKEVRMVSSIAYAHEDFEICKDLVADRRLLTDPLHTSTVKLTDLAEAFARLADQPSEIKILVDPRGD
jgi:(R,R)-butanediol dehydrogenase/meso-butanediol dehydrogenase/diacetyl reductase